MPQSQPDFFQFYSAVQTATTAATAGRVEITVTATASSATPQGDLPRALQAFQDIPSESERTIERATFSVGRIVDSEFPILSLPDGDD